MDDNVDVPAMTGPVAFVLGGGGRLGAAQVGMLTALIDTGIRPDLILGTSVGAINGAVVAGDPSSASVGRLRDLWRGVSASGLFGEGLASRIRTLHRTRISLHSGERLEGLLVGALGPDTRIEDLPIRFGCVAACIETASAIWFEEGPLLPALLASSAVPGLFPPVRIGAHHFVDGGLVDSIPLARAVEAGARTIFVLQVGRIEQPLRPPRNPAEVAQVSFEIARRHRFATVMQHLPEQVSVHVLPPGGRAPGPNDLRENFRYGDLSDAATRIEQAEVASRRYLAELQTRAVERP